MNREQFVPYLRVQTVALISWWAALMFLEWAKPGVASTAFSPRWVLLVAVVSATITALCLSAPATPREFSHRRIIAVVVATILGMSVAVGTSPDFSLVVGLVVWGSLVAVLAPSNRMTKPSHD